MYRNVTFLCRELSKSIYLITFSVPQEYQIIKTAIDMLDFFTCIKFKEWDGEQPDYLIIWPVQKPNGYCKLIFKRFDGRLKF